MSKTTLALSVFLLVSTAHAADIPVVEKSLSGGVTTKALPPPQPVQEPAPEAAPSVQWDLYQQVQQLQQEVRQLRGQLEVQSNQIDKLKQDARSRYLDLDQRITQLGARIPAQPAAENPNPAPAPASAAVAPASAAAAATPGSSAPAQPDAPNPDDEKKAYYAAYEVFRSGGPNKAIAPMRNFIKTYPQSPFIPSAYYWLGEFYLAASPADLVNARKSFKIVVEQFADAPKAPSALFKLASLADNDNKEAEAIRDMQDILKRFPGSPEAVMARSYLKEHNALPPEKEKIPAKTDGKTPAKPKPADAGAASKDGKAAKAAEKSKP